MGNVITGTGVAVPPNVVTNDDLAKIMDTTDDWITSRTGVRQRHFVDPGTGSSDLAIEAGGRAIAAAGLEPGDIDLLITATMTPDLQAPGIVGTVQHGLGLGTVAGFDIRQQCSGFLYALDLADVMLAAGRGTRALVIGAEVHGGYLPWGDTWDIVLGLTDRAPTPEEYEHNTTYRGWSVMFGDGGGAMVLESRPDDAGFISSRLHTNGEHAELIMVPGLGFKRRPYADVAQIQDQFHLPVMDGAGLYRNAVRLMPEAVLAVLGDAGLSAEDLTLVVAHQANERILAGVRKQLGVSETLVPSNIDRWGNTTSGTLPILYHEMATADRVHPGDLVCFTAFGAGAHWGAMLYRVPD